MNKLFVNSPIVNALPESPILKEKSSSVVSRKKAKEITPEQFVYEMFGTLVLNMVLKYCMEYLFYRQTPLSQPWGKL